MDVAQYSLVVASVFVILLHDSTASRESAFIGYSELKGDWTKALVLPGFQNVPWLLTC